jgi:hypothetical protein
LRNRIKADVALIFCGGERAFLLTCSGEPPTGTFNACSSQSEHFQGTAMTEQYLLSIIEATDPDDGEDVAIRRSLVIALGNSNIELADMMNGHIPPLPTVCELSAVRREVYRLPRARPSGFAQSLLSCTTQRSLLAPSRSAAHVQPGNGKPRQAPAYGHSRSRQRRPIRFDAGKLSTMRRRKPLCGWD